MLAWDTDLPGFGLRVTPAGVRSYVIQYRRGARRVRMTLGRHGAVTCEEARRIARQHIGKIAGGGDPAFEERAKREGETVDALADRYLVEHAEPKKKPSSVASDVRLLRIQLRPALGRLRAADVTRADVTRLHHSLRETPIQANRALALFSKMMNLAERWGVRPDGSNPCRHVERFKERRRERFLSSKEIATLAGALSELENEGEIAPNVAHAVRLLMLTGARRGEICGLRWGWVDFERGCLRLPDSKTGAKTILLSAPARKLLADLTQREPEKLVLPSEAETPLDLSRPWDTIRERAEMLNLRIHDLRHTAASILAAQGESLIVIGRILGHTVPATTARYAHLSDDPVRAATERLGAAVALAFAPATANAAEPVQLHAERAS